MQGKMFSVYLKEGEAQEAVQILIEEAKRQDRSVNYLVTRAVVEYAKQYKQKKAAQKQAGQKKA